MDKQYIVIARMKVLFLAIITIGFVLISSLSFAQVINWVALPPYNTLWPLWSPALSPINAVTGYPTPIVTNLAKTTVLPSQPGLTWDPAWPNPWLLYNTPSGMLFYDPLYGINLWPPSYLIDPVSGAPVPISLPAGYADLAPTAATWIQTTIPIANSTYLAAYPSFAPPSIFLFPWLFCTSCCQSGATSFLRPFLLTTSSHKPAWVLAILGTALI